MRLCRSAELMTARRASGMTTPAGMGASVTVMGPRGSGSWETRAHSGMQAPLFSVEVASDSTMGMCSSVSVIFIARRASLSGMAKTVA